MFPLAIFTKSDDTVPNSRAEAPELTFTTCPALPIESELSQIPPEPEARTSQYVPLVGTFPVVDCFATYELPL